MQPRLRLDIGWRDVLTAAFAPATSKPENTAFRPVFPDGALCPALSVRTLFDAILTRLNLPRGAPVLMSAATIANMVDIVKAHGLAPVAVDLDLNTLAPAPGAYLQAQARTGAMIAVHAHIYGAVSPVPDAAGLCARGVTVIEDCAQVFSGAEFHAGDPDVSASLFSFGPIKRATALGGGLGVFQDLDLAAQTAAHLAEYEAMPDQWRRRRALKYLALKSLSWPPLYGALIAALVGLGQDPDTAIGAAARGFSGADLLEAIRRAPPDALVAMMAKRAVETTGTAERQARIDEMLKASPADIRPPGLQARRHAWWLFPLLHADPTVAVKALRREGFDATRGATSLRTIDPQAAPNAARLMDQVVYCPNPAEMSIRRAKRLARAIRRINGWVQV